MKIIDQTPLLDANGQLSLVNRIQGMLKYGFSWPANLQAQERVVAQISKVIEKGFTLFRNQQLGASEIIVPLVLIGPSGIYVMDATPLKGFYRARGDEWGTVSNGLFQPAAINILGRTARLAKILQVFFERQGMKLSAPVEPVLLAADPGMHIESVRPSVRVVMSDAIDRFAASLLTARPVYNATETGEFVERIQRPRSAKQAEQEAGQDDALAARDETPFPVLESSRMQSILNSPKSDALIETNAQQPFQQETSELDFALADEPSPTVLVSNPPEPFESGEKTARRAAPAKRRILGMTFGQLALLAVMGLVELCVLIGGAYFIFSQSQP